MASILARHAFGTLRRARISHVPRSIHTTPVALKKKGKVAIEDLFTEEDAFVEEDLIEVESADKVESVAAKTEPQHPSQAKDVKAAPVQVRKVKQDPAVRQERFEEQFKYIELRIGRSPTIKEERVRKRHFLTMLDLAQSEADVRKIVELIPRYKEAGGELMDSFAEDLARRCQELQCQPVALEVFGDFATYDVRLDINAARWLVHSLYTRYPLDQVLIATAFYPVYDLPPVSEDLATSAMLAAACYRHGTPESIKAADALQPNIQNMIKKAKLGTAPNHARRKQNKWISWALRKVNVARKGKEPFVPQEQLPLKIELRSPNKKQVVQPPKTKQAVQRAKQAAQPVQKTQAVQPAEAEQATQLRKVKQT